MNYSDIKCVECKEVILTSVPFVDHMIDEMYAQSDGEGVPFIVICEPCVRAQAERAWESKTESLNR